jgi:multidrug efflux pump subunit AcrB
LIQAFIRRFISERLKRSELHPDAWEPVIIRDPAETRAKLAVVAGDKYSYAELENFSDLIGRTLQGAPEVSKIERRGVLPQTVYLDYSQDRLAAYGLRPADLSKVLSARNIIAPGGSVETGERRVTLIPSGQFDSAQSIGDVAISATSEGAPVYLRDLVQISRGYQAPAQYLNYYTWQDSNGRWQRSRAITLAIYMRDKQQIARFGGSVNSKLSDLHQILPADLILAHTSDQPLQVNENIHLFLRALLEAIILVVIVSLLGFWGVASGSDHGSGHTHHARDDVRRCLYVGDRSSTSLHRNAHHRSGPSRRRAGSLWRRDQTRLGGRVATQGCMLARPPQSLQPPFFTRRSPISSPICHS